MSRDKVSYILLLIGIIFFAGIFSYQWYANDQYILREYELCPGYLVEMSPIEYKKSSFFTSGSNNTYDCHGGDKN